MEKASSWGYPHNTLRQLTLSAVQTDFFVILDVDVLPAVNASEALQTMGCTISSRIERRWFFQLSTTR
jgi:hypothetical protein